MSKVNQTDHVRLEVDELRSGRGQVKVEHMSVPRDIV